MIKFLVRLLGLLLMSLFAATGFSQTMTVSSHLRADSGEVVEKASVMVKRTNRGTTSDNNGKFSIAVAKGDVLVISATGYETTEFIISGSSLPDPLIIPRVVPELESVVVVGYETKKRSEVTTAAVKVDTRNKDEGGYSNFQQLIGGRAAGVNVMENSADPGGGISIEIRGISSLSFSSQPLYVVDGVPLTPPNLNLNNGNANLAGFGTTNPLAMLNPNDIESIDILKDAAATAIYGSRGSNGVVLITTKSGKAGKIKVSVNFNTSVSKPLREVEVLNAEDYATLANEAWAYRTKIGTYNASNPQPYLPSELDSLQNYDHQAALQQPAPTTDFSVSISGGDRVSKYYLSGQYFNQKGVIPNSSLNRYNGKFNYEGTILPKLTLTASVNITKSVRDGQPSGTLTNRALSWAPSSPLINPDGSFSRLPTYFYGAGTAFYDDPANGPIYYNPRFSLSSVISQATTTNNPLVYSSSRGVQNVNTTTQILANVGLSYQINKDLRLSGLLGMTSYNSLLENYIPVSILPAFSTQRGVASLGNSQNTSMLYQAQLNYTKKFAKYHSVTAVAVASAEKFVSKTQTASAQGFSSDITSFNSIQSAQTPGVPNSTYSGSQLASLVFRGSYNYGSRYFLSVSGRYDGTSKFTEENRYGFFPSVGLAWRVDQEKWFKDMRATINELKFRASWGLVGNQAINPYSTLSTLSVASYVFGGANNIGYAPSRLANPALQWEKTASTNLGLDIGFLKNRITFSADVYRKYTDGLLFNVTPPLTTGYTSVTKNIASITNEGLEFSAAVRIINNKKFRWSVDGNIAFNRNVVNQLSGSDGDYLDVENVVGSAFLFRIVPGQPIGQFYGYKAIGVWTDSTILTKPTTFQVGVTEGARRYADLNNDSLLNDKDRTFIGSALPKYFGGFSSTFSYKNFELTTFFSYSVGNKIFNLFEMTSGTMSGLSNTRKAIFDQRYQVIYPDTDPGKIDAIRARNATTRVSVSGTVLDGRESTDYYIEDGSFLRCRDVTLGYNLPAKWLKQIKLGQLKAYFNIQNLFTLTNYSGYNPEVNTRGGLARGVDDGTAPMRKTFRFGFTANF
jgi:TonB-linked SusC/RagA family outer membrane protein